jgi:hypothetical protein
MVINPPWNSVFEGIRIIKGINESFVTLEKLYLGSITNCIRMFIPQVEQKHVLQFIKIGNTVLTIEYELIGEYECKYIIF